MSEPTIHIRIISPQKLFLDTEAESLSSKNSQGPFDILPLHANFITMVENSPITIRIPNSKPLTFTFPIAIIYNASNKVSIYTY